MDYRQIIEPKPFRPRGAAYPDRIAPIIYQPHAFYHTKVMADGADCDAALRFTRNAAFKHFGEFRFSLRYAVTSEERGAEKCSGDGNSSNKTGHFGSPGSGEYLTARVNVQ